MPTDITHDQDSEGVVTIGENQKISMKSLQNIYYELTGKTERISKSFRNNICAGLEDLIQLNEKIQQLLEQYNVVANNCAVTVFYVDDTKSQFSSFDRFKVIDTSSMSTVENVKIEYNILILLPSLKKPQSYVIEVNIHSRAALHRRADTNFTLPKRIVLSFANNTGFVNVDYVDYTVARSFMIAIDHWYDSLPQTKSIPGLSIIKNNSEHAPFFFKYTVALSFSIYFYFISQVKISGNLQEISELLKYGLVFFSTIFVFFRSSTQNRTNH